MESITIVKLTKIECAVLARAVEILEELQDYISHNHSAREELEEAWRCLGNTIIELENMGNKFIPLALEEELEPEETWGEEDWEEEEEDDEPQPEELLENCWEFTIER